MTPAPLLTAGNVGAPSLYWTKPYANPVAVGGGDEYVWLGSTDHAPTGPGTMYRGFSASLDTPPTSWTLFNPPGGFNQTETPSLVYDAAETRPWRLYYHPNHSVSGGSQSTRLASYSSAWGSGTDDGEKFPATENTNPGLLDHTGYAIVRRVSSTDWRAWTLTRSATPTFGYWESTDGETWNCVNDTLDITSMAPSGYRLSVPSLQFEVGGTTYGVGSLTPTTAPASGDSGVKVVIFPMTDNETYGTPTEIWDPTDVDLPDNVRSVMAVQDPTTPALIHLYIQVNNAIYYDTYTVT